MESIEHECDCPWDEEKLYQRHTDDCLVRWSYLLGRDVGTQLAHNPFMQLLKGEEQ